MKKIMFKGWIALCAMFLLLSGLMPVNVHAGICGTTPCVDSADIINGQVTGQDISSTVMMPGSRIVDESVTGADIKNGSLTGTDIQDGSIGSADIQDGTVSGVDIGAGAVGTSQISDGAVTTGKIAPGAVGSTQIVDGAVNSSKIGNNAVGSVHITDGSIGSTDVGFNYAGSASKGGPASDLSCVGCVSQTELNFSLPGNPTHRVVVANSGGDYTTISSALAAISPTATDPYIIDVMPGIYIDNIIMKDYVHLRGAGRDVTIIQAASSSLDGIYFYNITNATVSGLTITGGYYGIENIDSSPTILSNKITGAFNSGIANFLSSSPIILDNLIIDNNNVFNSGNGIYSGNNSSPTINSNTIKGHKNGIYIGPFSSAVISGNLISDSTWYGIYNYGSSTYPVITGNTITNNGEAGIYNNYTTAKITNNIITGNKIGIINKSGSTITGNTISGNTNSGILNSYTSPIISNNIIMTNGAYGISENLSSSSVISGNTITENTYNGIYISESSPRIIHNDITNNCILLCPDIYVDSTSTPNISFNVYNDISGTTGVGMYNVNSNGGAAPAP